MLKITLPLSVRQSDQELCLICDKVKITASMCNAGHCHHSTGGGALKHFQQEVGEKKVAQVIDSQLCLVAVLGDPLRTHHHTWYSKDSSWLFL